MVNSVNIRELFSGLQDEMMSSLGILKISHAPTLGDYTELNWLNLFKDYLPKRYMADKAFIVDCKGNRSDAIDIVIYDSLYSPFLLNKNGVKFVPAESVYAVFEVKQDLSKKHIEYAASKAESARRLLRTSVKINNAGTIQKAKPHFDIIGGLLSTRSSWSTREAAISNSKKYITKEVGSRKLDFICCLEVGSFSLKPTQNVPSCSKMKTALISFFYEFLLNLQEKGTVPAMDIDAYIRNI